MFLDNALSRIDARRLSGYARALRRPDEQIKPGRPCDADGLDCAREEDPHRPR
jgi:hypothetical protein